MTHRNTAAPVFGNVLVCGLDLQPHVTEGMGAMVFDREIGGLDAPQIMVAGSARHTSAGTYDYPAQSLISRDMLDAYDYTDRTAGATDCASDPMRCAA